jgi:hypothetical protein
MGLSTQQAAPSSSGSGGVKITDGVYANLKKVTAVKDLSGTALEFINNKTFDLALEVSYEGDTFPQLYFGNLKFDEAGAVIGWGGGFIVARLFECAGISTELNEENRFEKSDLRKLIGKEVYVVSYSAGTYTAKDNSTKQNYNTWNQTFQPVEDEDLLRAVILGAWTQSRDKGYPKDYTYPIGKQTGSTPATQSSGAQKSELTKTVEFDDDDDLPF